MSILMHFKQRCSDYIDWIKKWSQEIPKWLDRLPIIYFQGFYHLSDVKMVVESSKVFENLAASRHFLTKLLFKCDRSKFWDFSFRCFNHWFKFLEIQISINKLLKWFHSTSMNFSHFLIRTFAATMLHVNFIKFFKRLDQIFFPWHVIIKRSCLVDSFWVSKIVDINNGFFAIPNLCYALIWEIVSCSINGKSWWGIS